MTATTTGKRPHLRFAALFFISFAVLAWPLSFHGRAYRFLVSSAVNGVVFTSAEPPGMARLVPDRRPGFEWYLTATIPRPSGPLAESHFDVDVYQAFCLPTAVLVALTLAGSSAPRGKRVLLKLLSGILVLQLRGSVRFIALERALAGIDYGSVDLVLLLVNRSLVAPLGMAFAFPLLLWIGLFRPTFIRRQPSPSNSAL